MKTRALIVDDEELARGSLSSLLSLEPDFEVAGECADGSSAVEAIARITPDLVFLDVQMPRMSGFEVLEAVRTMHAPEIVFVTAFDHFAVKAFETQAVDYLLKPFRHERFQAMLGRVRSRLAAAEAQRSPAPVGTAPDRMVVKSGDRLVFLRFDDVEFIRASANYIRVHLAHTSYEVRETLTVMESRLPRDRFVRIHRSYIVNLGAVQELYSDGSGEYLLALRCGRQLPVGPTYPRAIANALASARIPRFGTIGGI
jgi:two-component system LytT family response regulator